MTTRARPSDPWTSWAAARFPGVSKSQAAVLHVFGDDPHARTLEQITWAVLNLADDLTRGDMLQRRYRPFSESRIRTAVKELMEMDPPRLVDTHRTANTSRGNPARLIDVPFVPKQEGML